MVPDAVRQSGQNASKASSGQPRLLLSRHQGLASLAGILAVSVSGSATRGWLGGTPFPPTVSVSVEWHLQALDGAQSLWCGFCFCSVHFRADWGRCSGALLCGDHLLRREVWQHLMPTFLLVVWVGAEADSELHHAGGKPHGFSSAG